MSNEAAARLRWEIGSKYRLDLLDEALDFERKAGYKEGYRQGARYSHEATVERIRAALDSVTRIGDPYSDDRPAGFDTGEVFALLDAEWER